MATITKDDNITVETVYEESSNSATVPASPKAVKVGNDLYVGWYTNQASGQSGEIIGVAGSHNIRMFKRGNDGSWAKASEVTSGQSGAITSFDVGICGNKAACVWSLDEQFASAQEEVTLNGIKTLASSTVYALTPDADSAQMVAMNATNAQFAKCEGADVLTYAIRIDLNDGISNPYLSVQSVSSLEKPGVVVLDVAGVDLWMLENDNATKVASSDTAVALDGEGSITFDYTIPPQKEFSKAREFTLYTMLLRITSKTMV